jgi:hypothetical protein
MMHLHSDQLLTPNDSDLPPESGLRIILSRATDPDTCSFWIGLYKSGGQGTSSVFLKIERLDDAFKYLSEVGLPDDQAMMHSDSTGTFPRQFFLLPQMRFVQDESAAKAMILKTVEALGTKKAGLYLSPSLLGQNDNKNILREVIEGLARLTMDEISLLTSDIGVNQLLNISLDVKERLKDQRNIWVSH